MAKRELEEINASSMADIAFLLLVFFLVTTTFSKEKVVSERLPQKAPELENPPVVNPKNVLEIVANKNDQILLENEYAEINEIPDKVREFYVHDKALELTTWPDTKLINKGVIDSEVARLSQYPDSTAKLDEWKKKYETVKVLGSYIEMSPKAIITITVDNSTKFKTYLGVYDAILNGINSLREEMCQEKFNRPYNSLNENIEEDKIIKDAIDVAYPKRIMKAKNLVTN